jgi:hypothetical protein
MKNPRMESIRRKTMGQKTIVVEASLLEIQIALSFNLAKDMGPIGKIRATLALRHRA